MVGVGGWLRLVKVGAVYLTNYSNAYQKKIMIRGIVMMMLQRSARITDIAA